MRVKELVAAFGKSWWREATLMAVALGSKAFAESFFTAVLQTGALAGQRELVEQCLEEARHVTLEPFLAALQAPGVKAARRVELLRLLTRQSQPALLTVCEELARGRDREVVALALEILQRAGGGAAAGGGGWRGVCRCADGDGVCVDTGGGVRDGAGEE